MDIAYFAHELEDPTVRKRIEMLAAGGARITLLGFERGRHAGAGAGPTPHVLGRTEGGRLLSRVGAVLLAAPRAWRLRALWSHADAIVARNL
ncbi:MAG: glycosyl transferase family 1, partial [Gammaproteobacteria bacterium]|nr:glycosyl transferase family 1 [Gammaproteobacteria bacterium]